MFFFQALCITPDLWTVTLKVDGWKTLMSTNDIFLNSERICILDTNLSYLLFYIFDPTCWEKSLTPTPIVSGMGQ